MYKKTILRFLTEFFVSFRTRKLDKSQSVVNLLGGRSNISNMHIISLMKFYEINKMRIKWKSTNLFIEIIKIQKRFADVYKIYYHHQPNFHHRISSDFV